MIEALAPYESYRASTLPWMTRCPTHWQDRRVDRLFTLRDETPQPGDQRVTGYLSGRVTLRSNVAGQKIKGVIKDGGWKRIYPGDFAISGMNAHLGGMGVSDSLGKCSPIYLVLIPREGVNAHFVAHALRHVAHIGALKSYVNTIRFNSADFKRDALKLFVLPMPDAAEQAAIVRFLDHANRRIDRYIRVKREQIALLHEQKLVMIQQRVLVGVDATRSTRPSRISWVGDIPSHWDVVPTRYLFRPVARRDFIGNEPKMSMSRHHGLVRSDILHSNRAAQAATAVAFSVCNPGDLIVNKYQAYAGLFGAATERGLITANYSVFAPTGRAFTPYFALLYACAAYRAIFRVASRGVGDGMMPLYTSAFHRVPSVVPPLPEQREIVSRVMAETAGLGIAISKIEAQIERMREYRTRLVADVVTGQFDVRAAAGSLPNIEHGNNVSDIEEDGEESEVDQGVAA